MCVCLRDLECCRSLTCVLQLTLLEVQLQQGEGAVESWLFLNFSSRTHVLRSASSSINSHSCYSLNETALSTAPAPSHVCMRCDSPVPIHSPTYLGRDNCGQRVSKTCYVDRVEGVFVHAVPHVSCNHSLADGCMLCLWGWGQMNPLDSCRTAFFALTDVH